MSQFANFILKKTPYDLNQLAKIIDATYTKDANVDEIKQKTRFSASQIGYQSGTCARRWVMAFQGARFFEEFDPDELDRMQAGTDAHERIQKNMSNSGLNFDIETELNVEDPPLKGYIDAILRDFNGFDIAIEIKTTRTEAFASRKVKNAGPDYQVLQLLLYMYFGGYKYGLLLYENKNDHHKLLIPVEMTEANLERIEKVVDWMRLVYNTYKEDKLPTRPFRKNSKACKTCPLLKHCSEQDKGDVDIDPLDYSEIHIDDD